MLQTWYSWIWGISPILLCRSSQALSGWMGSVGTQLFSGLSRHVRSGSSPGSGWATQGHSQICPWSHSSIVLAVCFGSLSCWKVNLRPSLRSWALWSRFSSSFSLYSAPFIFPSILTCLPVIAIEKHHHSMMLPPPFFIVGIVLARRWAVPGFLQTWRLAFKSWFHQTRESWFLMVWKSFRCLLANSQVGCHVSFTEEWLPSGLIGAVLQWWLSFRKVIPSPQRNSGDLSEWPSGSWSPPWPKPFSPRLLRLAGRPALGRVLVVPNFFHLRMMKATVFFGTFNAVDFVFFPPFPRSVPRCNPVSEVYGQFLQLHDLVFDLTSTVNSGTLYWQMCA